VTRHQDADDAALTAWLAELGEQQEASGPAAKPVVDPTLAWYLRMTGQPKAAE
jgi:hypothetical protein